MTTTTAQDCPDQDCTTAVQDIDLRRLAELSGSERAFTTFYFSGVEGADTLARRAESVRRCLGATPDELEHFNESVKLIEAWLEQNGGVATRAEGAFVTASWALDLVEGYALRHTVEDALRVGASPYLRPLAELQDEYETFAVVTVDATSSRIYLVTADRVEDEAGVRGDVKNRVKKGGWSQKRYARRRDRQKLHYAKEIVHRLLELREDHPFERLILLGSQEMRLEVEQHLPPELAEHLAGSEDFDLDSTEEAIFDEALELYFDEERSAEESLWNSIRSESLSHGLGVTGATDVLEAAKVGRVEEAIVVRDVKLTATRCRDCENVVHGTPTTCQICGSKDVFRSDLVDELVRFLETSSARLEFADALPGLEQAGGVGAILRY